MFDRKLHTDFLGRLLKISSSNLMGKKHSCSDIAVTYRDLRIP